MPLILGVIGKKLTGKDSLGEYLEKNHQAFHIKHAQILDEILDTLQLPKSRRNEIDLGLGLRKIFYDGLIAQVVKARVLASKGNIKVINGIRFKDELEAAKSVGAKLVYLKAAEKIRYQRFLDRKEKADDAVGSLEQFNQQDLEETEVNIEKLGQQADYVIENSGSFKDFYKKIDEVIKKELK